MGDGYKFLAEWLHPVAIIVVLATGGIVAIVVKNLVIVRLHYDLKKRRLKVTMDAKQANRLAYNAIRDGWKEVLRRVRDDIPAAARDGMYCLIREYPFEPPEWFLNELAEGGFLVSCESENRDTSLFDSRDGSDKQKVVYLVTVSWESPIAK